MVLYLPFLFVGALLLGGILLVAVRVHSAVDGVMDFSANTFTSLIVGAVVSGLCGFVVWLSVYVGAGSLFPEDASVSLYFSDASGFLLGVIAGVLVLWWGLFSIDPGYRAYWEFLQYPMGLMGVGLGWLPRGITNLIVMPVASVQESDGHPREYTTATGVEIFVKSGSTFNVANPLKAATIEESSVEAYVEARLQDALRYYIGKREVKNMDPAYREKPELKDQLELAKMIRELKGEVSANGPQEVQNYMNLKMEEKGIVATEVQFLTVKFNDNLEHMAQLVFEKMLEAAALAKDGANKVAAAGILARALEEFGIDPKNLKDQDANNPIVLAIINFVNANLNRAMAMDGEGTLQHIEVGGNVSRPRLVVVNNPPTAPSKPPVQEKRSEP